MGFRLRDMTPDDVADVATVHVEAFNETHRNGAPGGPSYELRARQWHDAFASPDSWFGVVVHEPSGGLVAFAKGTMHDGGVPGFAGELNKIYALKRAQRQGVGRLLLRAVAERFLERDVRSMLLFGEPSSPTNGFYEAFGAEPLFSADGSFHGGYGWRDLSALIARIDGARA